jgi:predicted  nucleic acid-binding Zn-ribbon protein
MAKRVYVSSHESDFFINNTIDCAPSIPNEGNHKVGDLIISGIQQDEIIGWVCVKDGNPGEWEAIRNAGKWLDVELNKLNGDISEIKIVIKAAQSQLVLLLEQIQENKKEIANNKTSINTLNNEMKEAKSSIEQHGVLIGEIEGDIEGINSQINVAKQALNVLTTQVTNNSKAINTINTSVGENGVASKDSVDEINVQIDKLKEMLGINDSSGGGSEKGVLQQLEELRELIGANAEGDEEAQKGILQQLEEIRDLIGANAEGDEEAKKGLIQQLEALRELIGANAEEGEEARGGIIRDITNIKRMVGYVDGNTYTVPLLEQIRGLQNLVGTPAKGEDPATGLHREIENLQETIEEVKGDYLKFWVGTNAEYQALTRVEHGRLYIIID